MMNVNSFVTTSIAVLAVMLGMVGAQQELAVGDKIAIEGFVMDQYCIDLGVLMDMPSIRSLEGPDQHCK